MLLVTALSLPAQWTEAGDAGSLPLTAQVPTGSIFPLPSIAGNLTSGDVDMYLIEIANVSTFSASTVGGTTIDTQLFLFYPDGRGVTMHDGLSAPATGAQSLLTNQFVLVPGSYMLAITAYDGDPVASGQLIWSDAFSFDDLEHKPDGPRRDEFVDGWTPSFSTGAYTITLTGCTAVGREAVLPDNHHLTESATQLGDTGSTAWWRNGPGHFQVLYESSHFTNAGVTGQVFLDKMLFRGEDGEPNKGGQSWANVAVTIGRSTLTAATMTSNFANNLATLTASETFTAATVTMAPSLGATPNNYNIAIDMLNSTIGGHLYNPTLGNLLVDITMPTAPTIPAGAGVPMAMQDTTGGLTVVRGAGVNATTTTATTGTLSTAPPVMAFRMDTLSGPGGFSPVIPARNEFYSSACGGSPSAFYEAFLTGQPFDLVGLTLTPDNPTAPNFYNVTQGAAAFDATQVNAVPSFTGDGGAVTHALGFTFAFPGGTTTQIRPTSDGFVWLTNMSGGSDFTVTVDEFLNQTPRLAPCWSDFQVSQNTAANPLAGGHVLTTGTAPNRITYVTWLNIGTFDQVAAAGGNWDLQMAIFETTNVVEFRYGAMPEYVSNNEPLPDPNYPAIVGFSRGLIAGNASVDPRSRDLSVEVPFSTKPEGAAGNMAQRIVATPDAGGVAYNGRAFAGQSLTFDAVGVPAGALIGVQLLDIAFSRPGVNIPGIVAPGCVLAGSLNAVIHQVALLPASTFVGTVPLVIPPGLDGAEVMAQFALLDGLFGGPNLVTATSNAIKFRVGRD